MNLIVPKSGYIKQLIHISDIHIRNGDETSSRYTEYNEVFQRLFESISNLESIQNNCGAIVITGDTFHHKSKVETPGIKLFNDLMNELGKMAPVYIILGNHDFRQDKIENGIDFLEAFDENMYPNVCFLKETGLYEAGNVGFGLMSVKDTLQIGSGSGMCESLPPFPLPMFSENVDTTVALFHGTMICSKFTENKVIDHGYPWEWLNVGYDLALLGDVHKQQIFAPQKTLE